MTISDALWECIETLLDGSVNTFDDPKQMSEDEHILEVTAMLLRLHNLRSYLKSDTEGKKRHDAVDWPTEARKFILEYVNEHYL